MKSSLIKELEEIKAMLNIERVVFFKAADALPDDAEESHIIYVLLSTGDPND